MPSDTSWQDKAAEDLRNTALSVKDIAERHHKSSSAVSALLRARKIKRTKGGAARGPKPASAGEAISQDHRIVGMRIARHIANSSYQTGVREFGFSSLRLRKMEAGHYNFSLTELQKVAQVLGMKLTALFDSFERTVDDKPNVWV